VLQFNVPSSLPDGTIQHPPPRDQYFINQRSIVYQDGGVGNDWAVFQVFNNPETGLQPIQAQGASFTVVQDRTPSYLRVTGYGVDGPEPNFGNPGPRNADSQTQQTDVGLNVNSAETWIGHTADTQPGNSGSPIIDASTGRALGVHTAGGCTSNGGNNWGTSTFHQGFWNALQAAGVASTQATSGLPTEIGLSQNYPNPFNPSTVIHYQLPVNSFVSLKVYDLLGRVVATLVDEQKPAGYHRATFDAAAVGSGVYFYRMAAGNYTAVRKMVVVK